MFRHQSGSRQSGQSPWFTRLYRRRHIVGVSAAALGTIYYSWRTIHADESPRDARLERPSIEPSTHPDEVYINTKLSALSSSATFMGDTGISRFDVISIPNVIPGQNASLLSSVRLVTDTSWTLFTLYDGFDGWENVDAVSSRLVSALLDGLLGILAKYEPPAEHIEVGVVPDVELALEPFDDAINKKIKDIFIEVDNNIVHKPFDFSSGPPSKSSVSAALGAALSGSSAILAFYDMDPRILRVALTGNSRAVLGRRARTNNGKSSYEVHILTADQTCDSALEAARLLPKNPGESEPHVFSHGLSRAFGVAALKWSHEMQERLHREYLGEIPLAHVHVKTPPPYLSAEPEITTIQIKPGDFMVMASHGLWSSLTNEEVVGLVGLWLNRDMAVKSDTPPLPADGIEPRDLPVSLGTDDTVMYSRWRAEKKFLCTDNNAAGHLARNALGGANVGLTASLLALEPPRARKFRFSAIPKCLLQGTDCLHPLVRDNINMTVIFFDDK
ncbi:hypothetical protein D9615_002097 [Tricholomella constricta]|uniref:PPM-type phosphatase domain-containing protein n=1 Tax=Tricholomella constricta TaxID=117010 RepID=A0A8H5HPE4_9AGAR|nr:hypothetical protein D9615_002097 [Tricholomella constricta]